MDQGEVQAAQCDTAEEAEMLEGLLHGVGGEVPGGSYKVGTGSLKAQGGDGLPAGSGQQMAGVGK